jgi:hypothetical protein
LSIATISGDRNVIKEESEKILNCEDLTIEARRTRNVKTSDTSNIGDNWNHFYIIYKIP